jgi:hypothetical protein
MYGSSDLFDTIGVMDIISSFLSSWWRKIRQYVTDQPWERFTLILLLFSFLFIFPWLNFITTPYPLTRQFLDNWLHHCCSHWLNPRQGTDSIYRSRHGCLIIFTRSTLSHRLLYTP